MKMSNDLCITMRLLLVIFWFCGFLILSSSVVFAQSSTATNLNQQSDLSKRVDALLLQSKKAEMELRSEIKSSIARIDALKEATEWIFWVFAIFGALGSAMGVFLSFGKYSREKIIKKRGPFMNNGQRTMKQGKRVYTNKHYEFMILKSKLVTIIRSILTA